MLTDLLDVSAAISPSCLLNFKSHTTFGYQFCGFQDTKHSACEINCLELSVA